MDQSSPKEPSYNFKVIIDGTKQDNNDEYPTDYGDHSPNSQLEQDTFDRRKKLLFWALIISVITVILFAIALAIFWYFLRDTPKEVMPLTNVIVDTDISGHFHAVRQFCMAQPRKVLFTLGGLICSVIFSVAIAVAYVMMRRALIHQPLRTVDNPPIEEALSHREIGALAIVSALVITLISVAVIAKVRTKARESTFTKLLKDINSRAHFNAERKLSKEGKAAFEPESATMHDYLDLLNSWNEKPSNLDPESVDGVNGTIEKEFPMYGILEPFKLRMNPNYTAFETSVQNMIRGLKVEKSKRVYFFFMLLLEDLTFDDEKMGERKFVLVPVGSSFLKGIFPKANSDSIRDLRKIKAAFAKYVHKLKELKDRHDQNYPILSE